ncbi:hypothetical protein E2562_018100 [Oryza meyeriana var. granulata]|uniref:Peptidase A1 domain-containing protein n=1 Tax=Oryza meyeriana var. granulata TaxID=110450 RepID=A0A6G1CR76_9ORYZ|nr:hypothetical protein E2562_018100 [Oryza meyeriana var. granulata]
MMQQLLTLLVLIALPARAASAPGAGVLALLTHADAGRGLARPELVRRMAHRARARRRLLSSSSSQGPVRARVRAGLGAGGGIVTNEYLVHLSVGTPPRPVALTLDTGSDLVWTQCAPCLDCFEQGVPVLDPAESSTYAALPCDAPLCRALPFTSCGGRSWGDRSCVYVYHYGDKSLTVGQLAVDSFIFGSSGDNAGGLAARRLTFGCGHFNKGIFQSNETGIAGFGRGRWSLPSQLNVTSFSYCFTSMFESKSSVVTLGAPAELYNHAHTGDVRTTRLIKNPSQPSLYFVPLRGITVGTTRIPVPESRLRSSTIIDSGASITTLPEDVYETVKAEFVAQVGLPAGGVEGSALDLCFALPVAALWRRPAVPALTLHLDGADWELPRGNYVFEDYGARVMCVVLDAAPGDQAVIGNYQQQNTHVVYDLENDMLSFAPARCDKLAASL